MNSWNPEEKLKAGVVVSSLPVPGSLLCSPVLPTGCPLEFGDLKTVLPGSLGSPFGLHFFRDHNSGVVTVR